MSAKQMGKVWDHDFDRAEQLVMLALADHADHEGGSIYPSMGRIAWKTGYSRRHVIRIVGQLRKRGILILIRSGDPAEHRAAEYRIDWGKAEAKEPFDPSDTVSLGGEASDIAVSPALVTPRHRPSDIAVSPEPSSKPSLQPSPNGDGHDEDYRQVVKVYEQEIGLITQHVAKKIVEALAEFGRDPIIEALGAASENNVRKWRYVEAILERWRNEGRGSKPSSDPKTVKVVTPDGVKEVEA